MRLTNVGVGVALCVAFLGRWAEAQQTDPWDYRLAGILRQQLEQTLARYQAAAQSSAYSEGLRARAQAAAEAIRARLRDGDLRVGGRVLLTVEGQPTLSDTFVVSPGPALVLPGIGSVALSGVLRSEVEAHLARSVDRVYRGAVVRARLLTRVAVMGGVGRPGFHAISGDALVDDAITAAGGPATDALLDEAYIERGRERLVRPDSLQVAIREARTISDLGVQDGDRIVIPRKGTRDIERALRAFSIAVSLPFSILALTRIL